jgi:hypothetical protein
MKRFKYIREEYPHYWEALRNLYFETNSSYFSYGKTIQEIEERIDAINNQGKLF